MKYTKLPVIFHHFDIPPLIAVLTAATINVLGAWLTLVIFRPFIEIWVVRALPPLSQYIFMAWYLVKQRDNFTFTFANSTVPMCLWSSASYIQSNVTQYFIVVITAVFLAFELGITVLVKE
jgi:hypothetical protein